MVLAKDWRKMKFGLRAVSDASKQYTLTNHKSGESRIANLLPPSAVHKKGVETSNDVTEWVLREKGEVLLHSL